jgi:DNA invertase Pin-like site-specific DNA recombinase
MSGDLRALAAEYVALQDKVETVRRSMLACLRNGAGGEPVRPTQPARVSGGSESRHPNAKAGRQAEARILELLKERPMRTAEIATATGSGSTTVIQRLNRMKSRGEVQGGGNAGWQAAAVPA